MAETLVVDACVAAKWFVPEEDSDRALDLLAEVLAGVVEVHAPRALMYEVCHVLAKACAKDKSRAETAIKSIGRLFDLPFQLHDPSAAECSEALKMSVAFSKNHTDMLYLRLAESLDCRLCTADTKLTKGIPPTYPLNRIEKLANR